MLITSKLAKLLPAAQQSRAQAWLATHDLTVPYTGLIFGGTGIAIGYPTVGLGLFAVGIHIAPFRLIPH